MRAFAPGKLVLTGAYAVLEGAPAIAVAVSRGAYADDSYPALVATPEVRAALGDDAIAPHTDASAMFVGARKLGLGASAAILVATLAVFEAGAGADLRDPRVRDALFARAREAHAVAQSGGSGIDIAVSVHGGTIRYVVGEAIQRTRIPAGLSIAVFACGTSARTSELRAQVDVLAETNPTGHRACLGELVAIAHEGSAAAEQNDARAFVGALRRTARALARLGLAADVGIVPAGFEELEVIAAADDASFSVSGAGGGDVAVYVGPREPTAEFAARAHALGLFPLPVSFDADGVRLAAPVVTVDPAATTPPDHGTTRREDPGAPHHDG